MDEITAETGPNAAQIAYWNSEVGQRWVTLQERIDAIFAPVLAATIERAAPRPGEQVIDIGCGCGASLIELARRVAPGGRALGVDVSKAMLDVAEARIASGKVSNASVLLADAAAHAFAPASFDLMFSRFGVMFFDDPPAAFGNIATALRSGARLAFACWRPMAENSWFHVPFDAALALLPPQPPADPIAPGPFAFADPSRVRAILTSAGFSSIEIEPYDTTVRLADQGDIARAADFVVQMGPLGRAIREADPALRAPIIDRVLAALGRYDSPDGIALTGAIWLVTARI